MPPKKAPIKKQEEKKIQKVVEVEFFIIFI